MTPLLIDIEDTNIEQRKKRNGGNYDVQYGFAHTVNRDGSPRRYPEQFAIFPQKDGQGNSIPYKPGTYTLDPRSFRISNGFIEMAFPQLIPVKKPQ